jgi:hypothetical protein
MWRGKEGMMFEGGERKDFGGGVGREDVEGGGSMRKRIREKNNGKP